MPCRAVLAVLVGLLVTAAPAAAASQKVRSYRVSEVRDLLDRIGGDRGGRRDRRGRPRRGGGDRQPARRRRLRRAGFTVERMALVRKKLRRAGARAAAFPPADSAYHNYAEMAAEVRTRSRRAPEHRASASASARRYEGRELCAVKISDNVGDRRERARGAVHRPPARPRAPDRRDGALPAAASSPTSYGDRLADHQHRQQPRDLDRARRQPGRRRVRHRHRHATGSWRKNRQPNTGSTAVGTDLNRNWAYKWGCCGGSSGSTSAPRPTAAPSAVLGARDPAACATSSTRRVVGGVQQIKAHIDFHTYSRAGAVAVRLHDRRHRARR